MIVQSIAVAVIVSLCALGSAWSLMSLQLRLRLLTALSRLSRQRSIGWLEALMRRTRSELAAGCNACGRNSQLNAPFRSANRNSAAPHR